jgi:hypothetical protein
MVRFCRALNATTAISAANQSQLIGQLAQQYDPRVGRTIRVMLAAVGVVAAIACSGGLSASASSAPQRAQVWRATSGARVSLAPLLGAGEAGWCMQTITYMVTATGSQSSRACPDPPTKTGPVFAEACNGGGREKGAIVFVLTQGDVASVSIAGGARIPTTTNSTLPDGLRAVSLEAPEYAAKFDFFRHCPAVSAFDGSGNAIRTQAKRGFPLRVRLHSRTWEHPEHPPVGACELDATKLRLGTVAWSGAMATGIRSVPRLLGQAFLSCASTEYIHSGGHYISAAILLDALHPGATPPPLPEMTPLAGHPGVFEVPGSEVSGLAAWMVARRIPGAWLVVTEETPNGRVVPVELLEHLQATIHPGG